MLTFHLAGGPGGMAHMLDHFGPSLLSPWTRLAAPDLTPELRDRVVRGCAEEAGGAQHRRPGARTRPRARRHAARAREGARAGHGEPEPLTWAEDVRPEWIDYNGHLSEGYYVLVFGHATDAAMVALGMTPEYLAATGARRSSRSRRTSATSTRCRRSARLDVRPSVIGVTGKLLWLWHEMWSEDRLRATEEVLMVHVERPRAGRARSPTTLRRRAEALRVPPPEHASRRIAVG